MKKYGKYITLAKKFGMINAIIISPSEISFDIRTNLKCSWGCERGLIPNTKCDNRGTTYGERVKMVKHYKAILLIHSHEARKLSKVILELEKNAFLDGYYLAFALRACNLCKECKVKRGNDCLHPEKVRPCECLFGIDVYKTARKLGLSCEVLHKKEDIQNRYGFLLIE